MSPLRVVVVHNRYRSAQPSGEDVVVEQEADLLREGGHEVTRFERRSDDIAAMPLPRKALVPLGVPYNPRARADLAATLRAVRPDVVHVHNTFPLLSPSVLDACRDAGVPVVATLHNYTQVCPTGTLYRAGAPCAACAGASALPAVRHGCYRGSAAATVPVAAGFRLNRHRWRSSVARFLCISRAQRDVLVACGMPPSRLTVKYNVVPDDGPRRSGAGEHVLYLGRLTEEKGVRVLMAAWERADAGVPLVLAGAGPLDAEVAEWARGRRDVRFVGLRDRASCRELLAGAVAVVVPSVWLETFGLVVVEAAAAGVPAVVAGHGALAELVTDGVTGLVRPPGDVAALAGALGEVGARTEALGPAARARYEETFTPEVGLRALVAAYRAAMTEESGVEVPSDG